jgi:hypothetical protein
VPAFSLPGTLTNGNFSSGLTGWNVAGYAAAVGTQGNVVPVSGTTQGLIASGDNNCPSDETDPKHAALSFFNHPKGATAARTKSGKSANPKPAYTCGSVTVADVAEATLETDLNLPSGAIHTALPNNFAPTLGSAIWQSFTATAGSTLSFSWNFATNEVVPTQWDAALYSLQVGSNPAQVFELADTTQSSILNKSTGASPTFTLMTGYATVNIPITVTGVYTIGFISMQTGDDDVSSGTYISSVQNGSGVVPPTTPIPATGLLTLTGLVLMMAFFSGRRFLNGRRS